MEVAGREMGGVLQTQTLWYEWSQQSILARAYSFHTHQSHEEGSHSQLGKQKARPTRETVCEGACSVPDTSP